MAQTQLFSRFVEPGRLALITYGAYAGKLCHVTSIIDHRRVIVDGPFKETGVPRHVTTVKRLSLTDSKVSITNGAKEKTLKAALAKKNSIKEFQASSWGKKLAKQEARKKMTDFDRFKLMVARKKRGAVVKTALKKAQKGGAKKGKK